MTRTTRWIENASLFQKLRVNRSTSDVVIPRGELNRFINSDPVRNLPDRKTHSKLERALIAPAGAVALRSVHRSPLHCQLPGFLALLEVLS